MQRNEVDPDPQAARVEEADQVTEFDDTTSEGSSIVRVLTPTSSVCTTSFMFDDSGSSFIAQEDDTSHSDTGSERGSGNGSEDQLAEERPANPEKHISISTSEGSPRKAIPATADSGLDGAKSEDPTSSDPKKDSPKAQLTEEDVEELVPNAQNQLDVATNFRSALLTYLLFRRIGVNFCPQRCRHGSMQQPPHVYCLWGRVVEMNSFLRADGQPLIVSLTIYNAARGELRLDDDTLLCLPGSGDYKQPKPSLDDADTVD